MFTNKTWATAIALVAVVATVLSACAPATPVVIEKEVVVEKPVVETVVVEKEVVVEKPVVETVVVEVEKVVAPTPAPVPPEVTARAQTLNIAVSKPYAAPDNLNVYAGADRSRSGIHQLVYEYFFYENLQTGEYIPWLAEGYEYNDDFTAITVNLRDGVEWSDGEPFTADDVVFTYDTLLANPAMTWAAEVSKWTESV